MKTRKKRAVAPPAKSRCQVGPYKGYLGVAEYETPANVFHGRVLGIHDIVTFEGDTPAEVAIAIRDSVDDYLAHCENRGKKPNKPFSGRFVARLPEDLHRKISMVAESRSVSLNTLITEMLSAGVEQMMESRP